MKKTLVFIALAAMGALNTAGAAGIMTTTTSSITQVDVYLQYGSGDVIVWLTSNSLQSMCPYGFWLRATDPGYGATLAQVEAAYHSGTPVTITANTDDIWTGSSSAACLLYMVRSS